MVSETTLLKEIRNRNRKALEELHRRYAPVLLGLSLRYCGNRADAEDVLNDSFIKILSNIDRFLERPNSSFEGWLKRITVNTALNFIRERSKARKWVELDPLAENYTEDDPDPDSLAEIGGMLGQDELLQMICELPEGYRTVFNLYVFEEYSHKEIAEVLGCSESTSKSQLFKARAVLKKRVLESAGRPMIRT